MVTLTVHVNEVQDFVYGVFTLPDTDTDTETDNDTDNDKFYTTHFCRSLYQSLCRAV